MHTDWHGLIGFVEGLVWCCGVWWPSMQPGCCIQIRLRGVGDELDNHLTCLLACCTEIAPWILSARCFQASRHQWASHVRRLGRVPLASLSIVRKWSCTCRCMARIRSYLMIIDAKVQETALCSCVWCCERATDPVPLQRLHPRNHSTRDGTF
jgi:hypothetical protein